MLTPREQLKVAVLQRCAEAGLTLEQTEAYVKEATVRLKQANPLGSAAWGALSGVGNMAKDFGTRALGGTFEHAVVPMAKGFGIAAMAAPLAVGGLVGHLAGRGGGITDEDIQEERQRELVDAYHDAVERIQANRRRAQFATASSSGGRRL
jgi:hypothetical protein